MTEEDKILLQILQTFIQLVADYLILIYIFNVLLIYIIVKELFYETKSEIYQNK